MLCGPTDRAYDVLVAGTPADLSGERLSDAFLTRVRFVVQQPAGGQQHARCAETALQPVALGESFLDRIEPARPGHALDGADPVPVDHHGQYGARLDRR